MKIGARSSKTLIGKFAAMALGLTIVGSPAFFADSAPASPTPIQPVARPPQFVILAFDGSKSIGMWQETRDFAKRMTAAGKPLKFTYFINAAYYLGNDNRQAYVAPRLGAGKSAIGFGDKVVDVVSRGDQTNLAFQEGNEIANHAAGHFDGSTWNSTEWNSEFSQFYNIMLNFLSFNHTPPSHSFPNGWSFDFKKEVIGFRAPQLGNDSAMFGELPKFGIAYDTSLTASTNYWPAKNAQGVWNFPLSSIQVAGTARKTLSMDYNFFYVQSAAKEDAANAKNYEEQMYQSYLNYFEGNYNGNRAPLNIGHHFALWNNGAYWKAEQRFAQAVCGLPEVKCVTYRDLMAFMNQTSPQTLAAYRAGAFPHMPTTKLPVLASSEQFLDLNVHLVSDGNDGMTVQVSGRDSEKFSKNGTMKTAFFVNGTHIASNQMTIDTVRKMTARSETATIEAHVYQNKKEVQYAGYRVLNVGTDAEMFEKIEDGSTIADPAAAHGEENADNAANFPSDRLSSEEGPSYDRRHRHLI